VARKWLDDNEFDNCFIGWSLISARAVSLVSGDYDKTVRLLASLNTARFSSSSVKDWIDGSIDSDFISLFLYVFGLTTTVIIKMWFFVPFMYVSWKGKFHLGFI
jgi:hypothetical protein